MHGLEETGGAAAWSYHRSLHSVLSGSAGSRLSASLQCAQGISPTSLLLTSLSRSIPFAFCILLMTNTQRLHFSIMFNPLPTVLAVLRRGLQENLYS